MLILSLSYFITTTQIVVYVFRMFFFQLSWSFMTPDYDYDVFSCLILSAFEIRTLALNSRQSLFTQVDIIFCSSQGPLWSQSSSLLIVLSILQQTSLLSSLQGVSLSYSFF